MGETWLGSQQFLGLTPIILFFYQGSPYLYCLRPFCNYPKDDINDNKCSSKIHVNPIMPTHAHIDKHACTYTQIHT